VSDLGISLRDEAGLRKSLSSLPEKIPEVKSSLLSHYIDKFPEFAWQWRAGFSLLFYGYGSKYELLQRIAKGCTAGYPCIFVDGLSPKVHARSILLNVAALARDCKPASLKQEMDERLLAYIRNEAKSRRIFVIISNIDGPGLRGPDQQRLLSELASIPKIHLAASVDHLNAPLLWDLQTKDRFAWIWHHTPSFKPYIQEASNSALPSLFLGRKYVFVCLRKCMHMHLMLYPLTIFCP